MGDHATSKIVNELANRLGKDSSNFTAKSICRSAATQIAEAGTSVAGL